jgi:hypothetical protein
VFTQSQSRPVARSSSSAQSAVLLDAAAHQPVGLDVGAAEAIDGLLRIAHDEERRSRRQRPSFRGIAPGQVEQDFRPDRWCPELVDEDRQESLPEGAPTTGVIPQETPRVQQKVLEVQAASVAPPGVVPNGLAPRWQSGSDAGARARRGWLSQTSRTSVSNRAQPARPSVVLGALEDLRDPHKLAARPRRRRRKAAARCTASW